MIYVLDKLQFWDEIISLFHHSTVQKCSLSLSLSHIPQSQPPPHTVLLLLPSASRRISSGSTLKTPTGHLTLGATGPGRDKSRSPERSGRLSISRGYSRGSAAARGSSRKHLPIINPLVSLPMWPSMSTHIRVTELMLLVSCLSVWTLGIV